ncbi:MAG: ATP-binding protein [Eubacteriales bacterium]|nr:ATP-binding protein [Eubacteriales bacterium]
MLLYLVLGAALAVILSVVISRFLTRSLMKPINAIDLDDPLSGDAYEELAPMLGRMEKQNKRIKAQIDAMRSQRTELDAIISEMQEGLLVLDKKRKVLSANARAREILGLEENYSDKTLPEMCRDAELLRLIHSAGGESRYGEITANGRVYRVCAGKAGSEGGLVVLMEDITDEKNAEESRRQFTANVSHELRTPLTTISGYSEIIEAGLAPQGDIAALGGKVHSESLRMLSLIEDIIHLSAIDEGAKAPDFGKQDLLSVAVESVEKLRELSESKQVTLSVDGSSAYVMGSRVQLMELARNLIENGVKYNRENGHVWVSVLAEGRRAVISVRDDGIGIPPEDKPRVFERFYRVDKSRSKATGGTGLGLSIVKHIAQSHGADIRLTSALGKGTEIVVSFPICAN